MNNTEHIVYLDNNSTTKIDERVLDEMIRFAKYYYANPHSNHNFGLTVNNAIETARMELAHFINCDKKEIIFTSGSTESINIALKGVLAAVPNNRKHIITVKSEHKAVIDTCGYLESIGFEVTYLSVDEGGLVNLDELKRCLRSDTAIVSVMFVNNETGVIQPISKISNLAHEFGALFMTDATQAAAKIGIDVKYLGIDLLCLSGHKMYGPKGIGVLYVRNGVKLSPLIHGGGQEFGLRSGTLNVPGIVALGKACALAMQEMYQNSKTILFLRDLLEEKLLKIPGTILNGNKNSRIYNVTNICFPDTDANMLIGKLKNIIASNGSACTSLITEPSHVLKAMGLNDEQAFGSVRFSLGKYNNEQEIIYTASKICNLMN